MKSLFTTLLLMLFASTAFSQNYMDEIAKGACKCVNDLPTDTSADEFSTQLGLCMIKMAMKYKKKIKKDFGIDMDRLESSGGEEFGQIIGLRMATTCPDLFMKVMEGVDDDEPEEVPKEDIVKSVFEGKVTAIKEDQFIVFSVSSSDGRTSKFYWFTFIKSDMNLAIDYQKLTDQDVKITYYTKEFYDSRIGEYRQYKIIDKVERNN